MEAIICVAGKAGRSQDVCKRFGFKSKCLLPLAPITETPLWRHNGKVILDNTIHQLFFAGVTESELIIVAGEHNLSEIEQFLQIRGLTGVRTCIQKQKFNGTTAAVLNGLELTSGPFYLAWSDMLFRLPNSISTIPPSYNLIFTTSVSHQRSRRFDGIVCAAQDVLAISPRAVYKPGPFLMNTGIYFLYDIVGLHQSVENILKIHPKREELPIELVLHDMLSRGIPFKAESLDYLIDLGTSEDYIDNMKILYGGRT